MIGYVDSLPNSPPDRDHPLFGFPPLPPKFHTIRPDQWDATLDILHWMAQEAKVVMLDAPTGSGKTLIGEMVSRLWRQSVVKDNGSVYACTTKTLQDQVEREFPYATVLKGRGNYPTLDNPAVTADACSKQKVWEHELPVCPSCPEGKLGTFGFGLQTDEGDLEPTSRQQSVKVWHCDLCHPYFYCPYEQQKSEALRSPMPVVNTAYLLTELNGPEQFKERSIVVIDEADRLEAELMGYVEMAIGERTRQRLNLDVPELKTKPASWKQWVDDRVVPSLKKEIETLGSLITKARLAREKPDPKLFRWRRRYVEMLDTISQADFAEGWVYTGYERDRADVEFRPVWVNQFGQERLWGHADRFLLMSATVISPDQMAYELGVGDEEWEVVSMDSTFPPEKRLTFVDPVAFMSRKTAQESVPKMVQAVAELVDRYDDRRVLVHSVSYALTREITRVLDSGRTSSYMSAKTRANALRRFLGKKNGVLVAPSFDRGVDLADDECRVIIIPKVPFPNLGDKQIAERVYGGGRAGQQWYNVSAIRTIVQMTGRGMRHRDDWCESFILDEAFVKLYRANQVFFPAWWKEGLIWARNDPRSRELMAQAAPVTGGRALGD